jgi:filamentous hemagglutinin family protein
MRNDRSEIFYKNFFIYLLCFCLTFQPAMARAGSSVRGFYKSVLQSVSPPAAAQLPTRGGKQTYMSGIESIETDGSSMTVKQSESKAIINWDTFNVGSDASVTFDQQNNASWAVLNRIYDANPGMIYGTISAPGKVYLINQNGILFGAGSQVNVHTLIASALNISNDIFLNNSLKKGNYYQLPFGMEDYQGNGTIDTLATVSNLGTLTTEGTGEGSAVFLVAPRVENGHLINAPLGQVGLVAGTDVEILSLDGKYKVLIYDDFSAPVNTGESFGRAVNLEEGELRADGGRAGMYGNNVDQWGIIRSITAYKNQKGEVELRAAHKITTGAQSIILMPVDTSLDPETGKIVTVDDSFDIQSVVDMNGLQKWASNEVREGDAVRQIEHAGAILAPAGKVTLKASERIYLAEGSIIDAGGVKNMAALNDGSAVAVNLYRDEDAQAGSVKEAELPASYLSFKLNSVELRDNYAQKDGVLQGKTITTTYEAGSSIGDINQAVLTRQRTALERSIGGIRTTISAGSDNDTILYTTPHAGTVDITSAGDVIFKQGAGVDVSGGKLRYSAGYYDSIKLVSGMKIYDIGDAPANLRYDRIIGDYSKTYERFGIRQTSADYGRQNPYTNYTTGYIRGGDAGAFNLDAPVMVLDGAVAAGVTPGFYQTAWTVSGSYSDTNEYYLDKALSMRRGLETPRAGTLSIDVSSSSTGDSSLSVVDEADPRTDILMDTVLDTKTTIVSAKMINEANPGALHLTANNAVTTAADAEITLSPGGSFVADASRIEHQGTITAAGGLISLSLLNTLTTTLEEEEKQIILGHESVLDVAGERINNYQEKLNGDTLSSGLTAGGVIYLYDRTEDGRGVDIQEGAVVDVSGGYVISEKGKVKGAHAGILDIQGSRVALDGELRGYALAGISGNILGGSLTLRVNDNILAGPSGDAVPGDTMIIAPESFADTGFTRISLLSRHSVEVSPDAILPASFVRLNDPDVYRAADDRPELASLDASTAYMTGPSTWTLGAAQMFVNVDSTSTGKGYLTYIDPVGSDAKVIIGSGAEILTTPAVSSVTRIVNVDNIEKQTVKSGITLVGPSVEVAGTLTSLGGGITVNAQGSDVALSGTAKINAGGHNLFPDLSSTIGRYGLNFRPVSAGSVTLTALTDIDLAEGSVIDISGARSVTNRIITSDGSILTLTGTGNPGSLTLSFGETLNWAGQVNAQSLAADVSGIAGGTLSVINTSSIPSTADLDIGADDILRYKNSGFDDIALKTNFGTIAFGAIDAETGNIGRKLTLDAAQITGAGEDVSLSAPWIVLKNSGSSTSSVSGNAAAGEFNLTGVATDETGETSGWIDVIGDVTINGFAGVTLAAGRDITLNQAKIYDGNAEQFRGRLAASGNLTLDANRIYPGGIYNYMKNDKTGYTGYYSSFNVEAGRKITLQNSHWSSPDPVYSAGGSLTFNSGTAIDVDTSGSVAADTDVQPGEAGIEIKSGAYIAAPLGEITLTAPFQRIYLEAGSTLSTKGGDSLPVEYGSLNDSGNWTVTDSTDTVSLSTFAKSVMLDTNYTWANGQVDSQGEIVMASGATIDVPGGGQVFNYQFQPGVSGSTDPLLKSGRYLVFKDNTFPLPGETVYLEGAPGLAKGIYTVIALNSSTAKYAFLPGAYILEAQKSATIPVSGSRAFSGDGYPLTYGYTGMAGTSIKSTTPKVYSVRTAAEVINTEGDYLKASLISGNGGNVTINGQTSIIEGTISAKPWTTDYLGGTISLSAGNIFVQKDVGSLFSGGFNDPIADDYKNNLYLSFASLSGKGFREVSLGDESSTSTVTIEGGTESQPTELKAAVISLAAKDKITIRPYAHLYAQTSGNEASGEGKVSLATTGTLLIDENAGVRATHLISLDVNNVEGIRGNLQVDQSAIELKSANIYFGETTASGATGLHITPDVWSRFSGFENITFTGKKDIQFLGDTSLSAPESLTLDAARILDMNTAGASVVTITAPVVNIQNSLLAASSTSVPSAKTDKGTFSVNASGGINIGSGQGDIVFGGFASIDLSAVNDAVFKGKGSLTTSDAGLNISAARVITAAGSTSDADYVAPFFIVNAGTGNIVMNASDMTASSDTVAGGLLEMTGKSISLATVLQSGAGTIKLTATGTGTSDGITLFDGGKILVRGTDDSPGGEVALSAATGAITLASGSLIDVSADSQGDAGGITLLAPTGGVTIAGDIQGQAAGGSGGSFTLDTNALADFAALNDKIADGGFTESLDLRARTGDITIGGGQTVTAEQIRITADGNDINVSGTIDASGAEGGMVELYAKNNVNVNAGGVIDAHATGAGGPGGDVLLSAATGYVNVLRGSTITVAGGAGASNGTLYTRALRDGSDVKINLADDTVQGARAVYAEAVKIYTGSSFSSTWLTEANTYYTSNTAVSRLEGAAPSGAATFHLLPGIEWQSTGNITVGSAIDFTTAANSRYQSAHDISLDKAAEPGILTIRAPGHLTINQNIVDHPTDLSSLTGTSNAGRDSWGINLIAGADLTSADYGAVVRGTGKLTIAAGKTVYTESAPIRFASGWDTTIGTQYQSISSSYMINSTMTYNLGSYDGDIRGYTGGDLILNGGAIQTATGDIGLDVTGNLQLIKQGSSLGAIRTTGETTAVSVVYGERKDPIDVLSQYWTYAGGGAINLSVGRNVGMPIGGEYANATDSSAWDSYTKMYYSDINRRVWTYFSNFSADYTKGVAGIATMGGGDVRVRTGGNFLTQAGAFGTGGWDYYGATTDANRFTGGNLSIYAGGNIRGRFLNMNGYGEIAALGNFGNAGYRQQIELFNSNMNVTAAGEIQIAAIVNPGLIDRLNYNTSNQKDNVVTCNYTEDTGIFLKAGTDVTLKGTSVYTGLDSTQESFAKILPATLDVEAGGNIVLGSYFVLAPSSTGNLRLIAGGDLSGTNTSRYKIKMSDVNPSYFYGFDNQNESVHENLNNYNYHNYYLTADSATQSASDPLHYNDSQTIEISAGGDISNLSFIFPEQASIAAGGDIVNITYLGQNLQASDVSSITAGGDISMAAGSFTKGASITVSSDEYYKGLIQAGPGAFVVAAEGSINLGKMKDGIQSIANRLYSKLGNEGADLFVLSGYSTDSLNKSPDEVREFFAAVQAAGDEYSRLSAEGKLDEAAELLAKTREEMIYPFLSETADEVAVPQDDTRPDRGNIDMIESQIGTIIGKSDLYVLARGDLNIGKTALPTAGTVPAKTGITTSAGGSVNIFTLRGDVNVNESRVMTFYSRANAASLLKNVNLGKKSEAVLDALMEAKSKPDEDVFEDFLAASDFSAETKIRLLQVKDAIMQMADISIWADQNDIKAGRGSRSAVSATSKITLDDGTSFIEPPAVGSGIRAATVGYGSAEAGNIHLFAPEGVIDAGEAEISGGKITMAAQTVVNVQNIVSTSGTVGVSGTTASTASLGSLSGAGSVAQNSQLLSSASGLGAAGAANAAQMIDDVMTQWLDVKVIDFIINDNEAPNDNG